MPNNIISAEALEQFKDSGIYQRYNCVCGKWCDRDNNEKKCPYCGIAISFLERRKVGCYRLQGKEIELYEDGRKCYYFASNQEYGSFLAACKSLGLVEFIAEQ